MSKMDIQNAKLDHKRELRNIQQKHENELLKNQLLQQKRLNQQDLAHRAEIYEKRNEHQEKLINQTKKNEEVLNNLKTTLEDSKERLSKEIVNLKKSHKTQKEMQDANFKSEFTSRNIANELSLNDLNHTAALKQKELQEQIRRKERDMSYAHLKEAKTMESDHKDKVNLNKTQFFKKYNHMQTENAKEIYRVQKNHRKQLAEQEQKTNFEILKRVKFAEEQRKEQEVQAKTKLAESKAQFDSQYKGVRKKNERIFQYLLKNKEKITDKFSKDLFRSYKLNKKKAEDPFYSFGKIEPVITSTPNSYIVKIQLPEHDAQHLEMTAQDRKLKLTFNRDFRLKKEDDNTGAQHRMSKHESYTSYVPVEQIINPDTLAKSYENGHVVFKVDFA
jgi:hypothetical protein